MKILLDYIRIRKTYRLTGNLIGVTVSHPHDSTIKGLPAAYSPYEVQTLIDEGVVRITSTPRSASSSVQEEYAKFIAQQREAQKEKWISENREMEETDLFYQLPTECPWRDLETTTDPPIPSPDPVKYQVYRDLWRRNYFITNGHNFGGDFLIYPQDPIVCHATHVVHVLEETNVGIKDFITVNRLCVGVKKECLFAYRDPEDALRIKYQSSTWDSTWNK